MKALTEVDKKCMDAVVDGKSLHSPDKRMKLKKKHAPATVCGSLDCQDVVSVSVSE